MEGTDWDALWKRDQVQKSERGVGKRKNIKQTLAKGESTNPGRDTVRDESSFTKEVSEVLFAVEMKTVSMRTGDVQQLDNACAIV